MDRGNVTLLMDLLDGLREKTSGNTLMMCTYEFNYCWEQVPSEYRASMKHDNISKVFDYMENGQLLQAKDISYVAREEYENIQTYMMHYPNEFKVNYWNTLNDNQQTTLLKKYEDMSNTPKEARVKSDRDKPTKSHTPVRTTPRHVTQVSVGQHGTANNSEQKANKPSFNQMPKTSKSLESRETTGHGFHDNKCVPQQLPGDDVSKRGSLEVLANDSGTMVAAECNGTITRDGQNDLSSGMQLNSNSSREEIAKEFMNVYTYRYRVLIDSLTKQNVTKDVFFKDILSFVRDISEVCKSLAKEQIRCMEDYLITVMDDSIGIFPEHTRPAQDDFLLFEFRRQNAQLSLETLYKRSLSKIEQNNKMHLDRLDLATRQRLHHFVYGCVEVIWYMTIQDNPLVLVYDGKTETDVTRLFQGSSQSIRRLEHIIWPAVRSSPDGQVIEKGVALFTK